jgi:NDP-sugar pyrophosphorylase family protein
MWGIVLAGGKGERLRPFTEARPKAMVEILGTPILGYQLRWLRGQSVTNVVLACGYRHDVIRNDVGDGTRFGVRVIYSIEREPLGRGGALRLALERIPETEDVIIAANGDVITDFRLAALLEAHRSHGALATVVLAPLISPVGVVEVDDGWRVTSFREKPELPYWINAGIYALSPAIRDRLPERGDHETTTFPELARDGRLAAVVVDSYCRSVDTIKDVNEVAAELRQRPLGFAREAPAER